MVAAGFVMVLAVLLPTGEASWAGPVKMGPTVFAFSKNLQTGTGELLAFNALTGAVVNRMDEPYNIYQPELLISWDGSSLYLLGGGFPLKGGKISETELSLIDTHSWKVLASTTVPQRMQYIVSGAGPATMTLSPDGRRLFIYSYHVTGPGSAEYWISIYQPGTLSRQRKIIRLPGCGVAYFTTAHGQLVVQCFSSNDVRFISLSKLKVTARVKLPAWWSNGTVGLEATLDGRTVYLVSGDMRFISIDTVSHHIVQKMTAFRQDTQTVPSLYGVALTSSQDRLVVGSMARSKDTASPFSLRSFYLPWLKPAKPTALPQFTHFTPAPGGGLYTFSMGDSSDHAWQISLLSSDLSQSRTLLTVGGPIFQVAVPAFALAKRDFGGLP